MTLYVFSISLAIISNILYHVFAKATPNSANPLASLLITYATAFVTTLVVLLVDPSRGPLAGSFKSVNWTSIALGISIVGLEVGFLLAYRVGWNVSIVVLLVNTTVALLLIPVGILLYKEVISLPNIFGILLCIAGMVFILKK